jgi:hypothetical protein
MQNSFPEGKIGMLYVRAYERNDTFSFFIITLLFYSVNRRCPVFYKKPHKKTKKKDTNFHICVKALEKKQKK